MQVRMPVGPRAVRLQARDDARREIVLTGQRADRGCDRAGGDAGDLAKQAAAIETIGAEPLGDGETLLLIPPDGSQPH